MNNKTLVLSSIFALISGFIFYTCLSIKGNTHSTKNTEPIQEILTDGKHNKESNNNIEKIQLIVPPDISKKVESVQNRYEALLDDSIDVGVRLGSSSTVIDRYPPPTELNDITALSKYMKKTTGNVQVRNFVYMLLVRSDYDGLLNDVVESLNNPEEVPVFRAYCVQYLHQLYFSPVVKYDNDLIVNELHKALNDTNVDVRREAILGLTHVKDPGARDIILDALQIDSPDQFKDVAARCAANMRMNEAIPLIRNLLEHDKKFMKVMACKALASLGDKESMPAIEALTNSDDKLIKSTARRSLEKLKNYKEPETTPEINPAKNDDF